jgi:hypothetical protein
MFFVVTYTLTLA